MGQVRHLALLEVAERGPGRCRRQGEVLASIGGQRCHAEVIQQSTSGLVGRESSGVEGGDAGWADPAKRCDRRFVLRHVGGEDDLAG